MTQPIFILTKFLHSERSEVFSPCVARLYGQLGTEVYKNKTHTTKDASRKIVFSPKFCNFLFYVGFVFFRRGRGECFLTKDTR